MQISEVYTQDNEKFQTQYKGFITKTRVKLIQENLRKMVTFSYRSSSIVKFWI